MSNLYRPCLKAITLSLLASLILIAAQSVTRADEITYSASTTGCFGAACTPSLLGLSFTGNPGFSGTTVFGFQQLSNLGTFTLGTEPNFYFGTFELQITFTQPGNIIGGQTLTIPADVFDFVNVDGTEGVLIHFNNSLIPPVIFGGVGGDGGFQLSFNDLVLAPGQTGILQGHILTGNFGTPIPEPASLLLLGTGLAGLIGYARRRRKRNQSRE